MFLPTPCISSAVMRLFNLWDVVNLFILIYFCLRRSIFQENKPPINLVSKQTNIESLSRVQTDAILLANNSQHCWMLHVASVCTPCCMLLDVVACYWAKFETGQTFSQQLPTFLLFRDRRSVAQQCWIRLHSSSNIVGVTNAHYAWSTKRYGLYLSHDALRVPTLLGVVASVCRPLPTRTQQFPTLLALQCWELLRPFARSLKFKV